MLKPFKLFEDDSTIYCIKVKIIEKYERKIPKTPPPPSPNTSWSAAKATYRGTN